MNKFAAFAVLALAALAVSVSSNPISNGEEEEMTQAVFKTTNEDETAGLKAKNLEVFSDFCISSRDFIFSDIKSQTDTLTSGVFNMIFSSAAEIAKEGLNVQQDATEKLAAQLANPDAAIEGGDSEVDKIIANGQAQIQSESQPRSLLTAFKSAIGAVSNRVGSLVSQRINLLTSKANPSEVLKVLSKGCEQIAAYETELKGQLETYKKDLPEEYKSLNLDAVPCATSSKIISSEGVCSLFRVAIGPVKKIAGIQ